MKTYRVMDYDNGGVLHGVPTSSLVEASEAASPTGAVKAWFDADSCAWEHLPSADEATFRLVSPDAIVATVYVEDVGEAEEFALEARVPGFQKNWGEAVRNTARGFIDDGARRGQVRAVNFEPGNGTSYRVMLVHFPAAKGALRCEATLSWVNGAQGPAMMVLPEFAPAADYIEEKFKCGASDARAIELLVKFLLSFV